MDRATAYAQCEVASCGAMPCFSAAPANQMGAYVLYVTE